MHVTKTADNAVRAMDELTAADGEMLKAEQLARSTDISRGSLENIMLELKRAGLVVTHRGSGGGYALACDPQHISLADIIRSIDGPLVTIRGLPPHALTYAKPAAKLQEIWIALQQELEGMLEAVSLADIGRGAAPPLIMASILGQDVAASY